MTIEKFEDLLRDSEPWESWLTYSTWFAVNTRQRKIRNNGRIKIDLRSWWTDEKRLWVIYSRVKIGYYMYSKVYMSGFKTHALAW